MKATKFKATGMIHYMDAIRAIQTENDDFDLSRGELLEDYGPGDKIWKYDYSFQSVELIPEPENEYDPNAVAVYIDGKMVAHIKRGSCSQVKNLISADDFVKAEAEIGGGPYKYIDEDDDGHVYIDTNESEIFIHITIYNDRQDAQEKIEDAPILEKADTAITQEAPEDQKPKKRSALKIICLVCGVLLVLMSLLLLLVDICALIPLFCSIIAIIYGIRK